MPKISTGKKSRDTKGIKDSEEAEGRVVQRRMKKNWRIY
jgi:hypothetical protein